MSPGYYSEYSFIGVLSEDADGNQQTMEFVSDTEAREIQEADEEATKEEQQKMLNINPTNLLKMPLRAALSKLNIKGEDIIVILTGSTILYNGPRNEVEKDPIIKDLLNNPIIDIGKNYSGSYLNSTFKWTIYFHI